MRIQNPTRNSLYETLVSIYKVLRGNISFGSALSDAADGTIATFNQDNTDGILIRVGSDANPLGLTNFWSGTDTDTTIVHSLTRVPVGYIVCGKDKTCDIYYGTIVADANTITLKNTDGTADTLLYIF